MAFEFLSEKIKEKRKNRQYRQIRCIKQLFDNRIEVDGKVYINFSSNDYLGLAADKSLIKAYQAGADKYGSSAVSSSLITGYHESHKLLEDTLCEWTNNESALLFTSGFAANSGVLKSLDSAGSHFILDKLAHASMIDAVSQGRGKFSRFFHNDTTSLNKKLQSNSTKDNIVVTESIFSMDGDCAPIRDICAIVNSNDSMLYIDDAHGLGVLGSEGQGVSSLFDINEKPEQIVTVGTFGKAIATSGAFVTGSKSFIDYLVNECRHYIYSTAICPATAWATKVSIELIKKDNWRREKLTELTELFVSRLNKEIEITPTASSIVGVVTKDEESTIAISEQLKINGFWVSPIRPPTVPRNKCRLRVTINSHHKASDIIRLANCINKEYKLCQR